VSQFGEKNLVYGLSYEDESHFYIVKESKVKEFSQMKTLESRGVRKMLCYIAYTYFILILSNYSQIMLPRSLFWMDTRAQFVDCPLMLNGVNSSHLYLMTVCVWFGEWPINNNSLASPSTLQVNTNNIYTHIPLYSKWNSCLN